MTLLLPKLPRHSWWGKGITPYSDNWAMEEKVVPNQKIVKQEYQNLVNVISKHAKVAFIPFPTSPLPQINDDFLFIRDHYVLNKNNCALMLNANRPERKGESIHTGKFLNSQGIKTKSMVSPSIADGGEFHFLPSQDTLFAGLCRNNISGVQNVSKFLKVKDTLTINQIPFHLDTCFVPLISKSSKLIGLIACPTLIKNYHAVLTWAKSHKIPVFEIDTVDSMGSKSRVGNLAVNGLYLPGIFINGHKFVTPGIEKRIKDLGIKREISATSQFNLSGGSIHCLTNELYI